MYSSSTCGPFLIIIIWPRLLRARQGITKRNLVAGGALLGTLVLGYQLRWDAGAQKALVYPCLLLPAVQPLVPATTCAKLLALAPPMPPSLWHAFWI